MKDFYGHSPYKNGVNTYIVPTIFAKHKQNRLKADDRNQKGIGTGYKL